MDSYIDSIYLTNFRNHRSRIVNCKPNLNCIIGKNGAGKTSILESISLISSSTGIRNATNADIQNLRSTTPWEVNLNYISNSQSMEITIDHQGIRLNNTPISRKDISQYLQVIWIDPLTLTVLDKAQAPRRDLIDKVTSSIMPEHKSNLTNFKNMSRKRLIAIKTNSDVKIVDILEAKMSQYASRIAFDREQCIYTLNDNMQLSNISIQKTLASPCEFEMQFKVLLAKSRSQDKVLNKTSANISSKIFITCKGIESINCSTGYKSMILLDIVLAWAKLIHQYNSIYPIVLIDDAMSHMDQDRVNTILSIISSKCQVICTSINPFNASVYNIKF